MHHAEHSRGAEATRARPRWLEFGFLAVVCAAASALWVFIEVAESVVEGETHAFDVAILLALRTAGDPADPFGPRWLEQLARDITALGSPGVLTLLVVAVSAFLLLVRRQRSALLVLAATGTGALATRLLKLSFDRPRPELIPPDITISTASFPSGHAMGSAFVYLTLGALLAQASTDQRSKLFAMCLALALTGLVGISRVYLGVHWPSDVLAGWAAGACWAIAWWALVHVMGLEGPPGSRSLRKRRLG